MLGTHGITSDIFAQKQNWATAIDARIKMVFVSLALLLNLLSPTVYTPLSFAISCLTILMLIGVPPKLLGVRLLLSLVMAGTASIVQLFFYGHAPLFTIHLWHFQLTGYEEGLTRGFLIMSRVMGGVSLVLFLSMSTPVSRLLGAARWFRLSPTFVELALLVYRYVFVLLEEVSVITNAQRVRLGYNGWRQTMKSLEVLGGSVVLRAYERAQRIFEAMLVRGYSGDSRILRGDGLHRGDYLASLAFAAILAVFYIMGRVLK